MKQYHKFFRSEDMGVVNLFEETDEKTALVIDSKDNVAVALTDLKVGDVCRVRNGDAVESVSLIEDVGFGHKLALQPIGLNESVLKYGEEIGKMNTPVEKGGWIHSHNMYCERGRK
jgi:altronate dehydratase small subunit